MTHAKTTWNYILSFKGWAQCRMATDPDPSNDRRGVSGYSFALPGEPDFTRIAYFQDGEGVVPRSHGPKIGVRVTDGTWYKAEVTKETVDGTAESLERYLTPPEPISSDSPFCNACVDLLNEPVFDSRNSTIVYDGYGLVSPFDLQIRSDDGHPSPVSITRSYYVDPAKPEQSLESIPIKDLMPHIMSTAVYDAENPNKAVPGSPDMLLESGIINPSAYRRHRLELLQKDLHNTQDPITAAALKKRISELQIDDPQNRRTAQLGAKVLVPYNLNSTHAVVNGTKVPAGKEWSLEMWMGGWDADSLCFFVMGTVRIVLDSDPSS